MAKIAISLPDSVLDRIERERKARGVSRSEFLRLAVDALLLREQQREEEERYIRGYLEHPETEEELGWVQAASQAVLKAYPWEDEAENETR